MTTTIRHSRSLALIALLGAVSATGLAAQTQQPSATDEGEVLTTVYGSLPPLAEMAEGPKVTGIISARRVRACK